MREPLLGAQVGKGLRQISNGLPFVGNRVKLAQVGQNERKRMGMLQLLSTGQRLIAPRSRLVWIAKGVEGWGKKGQCHCSMVCPVKRGRRTVRYGIVKHQHLLELCTRRKPFAKVVEGSA